MSAHTFAVPMTARSCRAMNGEEALSAPYLALCWIQRCTTDSHAIKRAFRAPHAMSETLSSCQIATNINTAAEFLERGEKDKVKKN